MFDVDSLADCKLKGDELSNMDAPPAQSVQLLAGRAPGSHPALPCHPATLPTSSCILLHWHTVCISYFADCTMENIWRAARCLDQRPEQKNSVFDDIVLPVPSTGRSPPSSVGRARGLEPHGGCCAHCVSASLHVGHCATWLLSSSHSKCR